MDQHVDSFFSRYDEANRSSDFATLSKLYADRFMFARSNESNVIERENFLRVLPLMKTNLRSMGLLESHVQTVEAHPLDSNYLLAKVGWQMGIRSSSGTKYVDVFATFILARSTEDSLSIVFQLDHQDLSAIIRSLQASE